MPWALHHQPPRCRAFLLEDRRQIRKLPSLQRDTCRRRNRRPRRVSRPLRSPRRWTADRYTRSPSSCSPSCSSFWRGGRQQPFQSRHPGPLPCSRSLRSTTPLPTSNTGRKGRIPPCGIWHRSSVSALCTRKVHMLVLCLRLARTNFHILHTKGLPLSSPCSCTLDPLFEGQFQDENTKK